MKIAISADGIIDIPKKLADELDLKIINLRVSLGEKDYRGGEVTPEMIFDYVKSTGKLPKTSSCNPFEYEEHFANLLKDYEAVVHISFSSRISSSYSNALQAASNFEGKVFVVDTLNLSATMALAAIRARKLIDEGKSASEVAESIKNYSNKLHCSFIVENVDYLYKGGRCSKLSMLGANLLHIRPSINLIDGKLEPGKKYRGRFDVAALQYFDDFLANNDNFNREVVFVGKSTFIDEKILKSINEKLLAKGAKKIYFFDINATICCYCGPETFGVLWVEQNA